MTRDDAVEELRNFYAIIDRLRAPGGCPWDREQTHESLAPFLLEEAHETLDAIPLGSAALCEELGDLLLQVFMHSAIAAERRDDGDGFDIGDVAHAAAAKMVHRHPHVFGDASVAGADEVVINWEKLKASEKKERESILDGIPRTLPALATAQSVQRRPARIGFRPNDIDRAVHELTVAVAATQDAANVETPTPALDEDAWVATDGGFARGAAAVAGDTSRPPSDARVAAVGELLFAAVAVARALGVDAELALRATTDVNAAHFRRLERRARADGVDLHGLDDAEWESRWSAALHEKVDDVDNVSREK